MGQARRQRDAQMRLRRRGLVANHERRAYFVEKDGVHHFPGAASRKSTFAFDSHGNAIRTKEHASDSAGDWYRRNRRWPQAIPDVRLG